MKSRFKKILCLTLVLILALGASPFSALAADAEVTVRFPGTDGVSVFYYVGGAWYDGAENCADECTFTIADTRWTGGPAVVQVSKGGMYYSFENVAFGAAVSLDVPVRQITVSGIGADCSLGLVQADWVYRSAPVSPGSHTFNVFDNAGKYTLRLNKPGFHTVDLPGIAPGQTDISEYFYTITLPGGILSTGASSLRLQSNNWIQPSIDTLGGSKRLDLIKTGRDAWFDRNGGSRKMTFPLDGETNPFDGKMVVSFPNIDDVTVYYSMDGETWAPSPIQDLLGFDGSDLCDNFCVFDPPVPGAPYWFKAVRGDMQAVTGFYTAPDEGEAAAVVPIGIAAVRLEGLPAELSPFAAYRYGISAAGYTAPIDNRTRGNVGTFYVFAGDKRYYTYFGADGFQPIEAPVVAEGAIQAGETYVIDFSKFFYELEVPEGYTDVAVTLLDGKTVTATAGDTIPLFMANAPYQTYQEAGISYQYSAQTITKRFLLDGSNPFTGIAPPFPPPPLPPPSAPIVDPDPPPGETTVSSYAEELHKLGLFLGVGADENGDPVFALDQPLNRLDALILTVRLLGLEEDALTFEGGSPFSDVPDWGVPYVSFAFSQGITNGTSMTAFTPEARVSCLEFTAFLLRSLGYSEKPGDFAFPDALAFAVNLGLYDTALLSALDHIPYLRGDAVISMVKALLTPIKGSEDVLLLDTLEEAGVITRAQASGFVEAIARIDAAGLPEAGD